MTRCCLFLIAIAGISLNAKAQQQPNLDSKNVIPPAEFLRLLVEPEEVEGRVNLFTDWQHGEVFLSQGRFVSGIAFNYDVLNHQLLVLEDEKEFTLNPIAVDSILIGNSGQVLVNTIILEGIGTDLLLLRVYEGLHLSLFRNTSAKVSDHDTNTSAITKFKYAPEDEVQIDQEQMYFLLNKAANEIIEFQGKKKDLKKWENGGQLMDFIKKQNLDPKNEADLIQVVQHYEQLTFGVN